MYQSRWSKWVVEGSFLSVATVFFMAAMVAMARIHFLTTYETLSLGDFFLLAILSASSGLLGWLIVLALEARTLGERPFWRRFVLPSVALCAVMLVATGLALSRGGLIVAPPLGP